VRVIPAGTEFRDKNGELLVTVVSDIVPGAYIMATDFMLPDGKHPDPLMPIPDDVIAGMKAFE
jgi:hypothetical protein